MKLDKYIAIPRYTRPSRQVPGQDMHLVRDIRILKHGLKALGVQLHSAAFVLSLQLVRDLFHQKVGPYCSAAQPAVTSVPEVEGS